jgi:DNA replication protein DnaC
LLGQTGVGKSHIVQAIGHRACVAGHNVFYTSAHEMLTQLRASRADASYDRRLARLTTPDLLIIDDLGLRPLAGDEPIDLYEVIRRRYERASTITTSNRAIVEWAPLFKDELLAGAALDRLLHHAHVIEITGHSYRNPPRGGAAAKERAA